MFEVSKFGKTKLVKGILYKDGKECTDCIKYDEVYWVERQEDYYGISKASEGRTVLVIKCKDFQDA